MRKILIVAALLAGGALLTGSPAEAWVGCSCVKLGTAPVCSAGPVQCAAQGGVCLLPCDYQAPMKKATKHHAKKKHAAKKSAKKKKM
jgi:hypothetical protein